ncbi:MAG TPA: hypothetical protein VN193_02675 [Candidatus Angelobacter sp.]|jgi:hypothetical protein|nr:hypothetical protein [Candidatus Angelobacter sp.]
MRVEIKAQPVGALSVLHELPDARLAILEGHNGIGKSLSVRLLEICTGGRPYVASALAWRSLCENLGPIDVKVSNLRGVKEIHWVADTREWLDGASDPGNQPAFRTLSIDGKRATMDDVRRVLSVHRVGGDEGTLETLAQQLERITDIVARWNRRFAHQTEGPLALLEVTADETSRLLGRWSRQEYVKLLGSADDARSAAEAAARELTAADHARREVTDVIQIRDQLARIRDVTPDLLQRAAALDEDIARWHAKRDALYQRVSTLAGAVASSQPALKELENARRTAARNRERLSDVMNEASRLAARLEAPADATTAKEILAQYERKRTELEAERIQLDSAPAMRGILDHLIKRLEEASERGLGDQVAIDDPVTEIQLTVHQTTAGMTTRRAYLEGKPPEPQARAVVEELENVARQVGQAKSLVDLLTEAERRRRLVDENDERTNRALAAINPRAIAQIRTLEGERGEADAQLLKLAAERAALHQQLGAAGDPTSQRALAGQLAQRLSALGSSEEGLNERLRQAELRSREANTLLASTRDVAATLRRDIARADTEIRDALVHLRENPGLQWLRSALPSRDRVSQSDAPRDQLVVIDSARAAVDDILHRITEFRSQIGAVIAAVRTIAGGLHGRPPESERYVASLELYFGKRFSDWFNNPRVRHELLPQADGEIRVDLARREVIWIEGAREMARPLEAFSSGESAFAYTRARLAVLDEERDRPLNRLIVLDEFGAFIAHDRLTGLMAYLQERSAEHVGDQVLVILPLSRDYDELAQNVIGDQRAAYESLAAQIRKSRYAVQSLIP